MLTRDQFETCSRLFAGETVRALRHMRDVPRASIRLPIVHAIPREKAAPVQVRHATAAFRRAS